jgi:hypothetical protein
VPVITSKGHVLAGRAFTELIDLSLK